MEIGVIGKSKELGIERVNKRFEICDTRILNDQAEIVFQEVEVEGIEIEKDVEEQNCSGCQQYSLFKRHVFKLKNV